MEKGMKVTQAEEWPVQSPECKCANRCIRNERQVHYHDRPVIWGSVKLEFCWCIVDLQYHISFKYTAKWLSYYIHTYFHIVFHDRLLSDIECYFLCYTVSPCLSIFCKNYFDPDNPRAPNLSLLPDFPPW